MLERGFCLRDLVSQIMFRFQLVIKINIFKKNGNFIFLLHDN